ncbi:tRNA lysidine(34) synthetase TilS [Alkalibacterium indicireducens]
MSERWEKMDLLQQFTGHIRTLDAWEPDEPVIVAVSGGVDSVVLLDLMGRLPEDVKPNIIIAHVNHHLRGISDDEESAVRKLAERYTVPVYVHHWRKEDHPDSGIEKAARDIRYSFFKEIAQRMGSRAVLTAHHKDDQVETILMKLVRGSALEELKGISAKRSEGTVTIVRPLLPFTKKNLISYAEQRQLRWAEDESNASVKFTRNRYRQTILPLLRSENPAVDDHLIRFTEDLDSLLSLSAPCVEEWKKDILSFDNDALYIMVPALKQADEALQRRVLSSGIKQWSRKQSYTLGHKHIQMIIDWLKASSPNTTLDLPGGLTAERMYDRCMIRKKESDSRYEIESENEIEKKLAVGQWIELGDGSSMGLLTYESFRSRESSQNERHLYLGIPFQSTPLTIRHRHNGDRMTVRGMTGTKKVKDIFIDQKIPREDRERAWVVTDSTGRILWVVDLKESALSLDPRTDTISYVLVYERM